MELKEKILALKREHPEWGYAKIATAANCNSGSVRFHLNQQYRANVMSQRNVRRHRRKKMLIDMLGSECKICGYDKCDEALDFHHLDPNKKEFQMKDLLNGTDDQAIEEAKKCILLCCRCHREVHAGVAAIV